MKRQCLLHILIGRLDVRRLICFNHKAFLLNRLGKRKMRVGMNERNGRDIILWGGNKKIPKLPPTSKWGMRIYAIEYAGL